MATCKHAMKAISNNTKYSSLLLSHISGNNWDDRQTLQDRANEGGGNAFSRLLPLNWRRRTRQGFGFSALQTNPHCYGCGAIGVCLPLGKTSVDSVLVLPRHVWLFDCRPPLAS